MDFFFLNQFIFMSWLLPKRISKCMHLGATQVPWDSYGSWKQRISSLLSPHRSWGRNSVIRLLCKGLNLLSNLTGLKSIFKNINVKYLQPQHLAVAAGWSGVQGQTKLSDNNTCFKRQKRKINDVLYVCVGCRVCVCVCDSHILMLEKNSFYQA